MRRLRSLLVEIYPPNLSTTGLASALADLVAPLAARDVATRAAVDPPLDLAEAEQLVYRTAQEALRNVLAHAGASRAAVRVTRRTGARGWSSRTTVAASRPSRPSAGARKGISGSTCCATARATSADGWRWSPSRAGARP